MRAYKKSLDITYAQSEGITALLEAAGQRWNILFYTFNLENDSLRFSKRFTKTVK